MARQLLVEGEKTFKITIPGDAKVTCGPWSPPKDNNVYEGGKHHATGTLGIYKGTKDNIIGCFAGVTTCRELDTLGYAEQIAKGEVAKIWKDDQEGHVRAENDRLLLAGLSSSSTSHQLLIAQSAT
jgi:hypothetical protein